MTTDELPEGVLSPDDLDPTDDRLHELDGDRYVVSLDGDDTGANAVEDSSSVRARPEPDAPSEAPRFPSPDAAYGVVGRARIDGETRPIEVESNDVAATFDALVRWYVDAVAPDVAPEEAVAVLLDNADIAVDAEVER